MVERRCRLLPVFRVGFWTLACLSLLELVLLPCRLNFSFEFPA